VIPGALVARSIWGVPKVNLGSAIRDSTVLGLAIHPHRLAADSGNF
jgi:hypothetical protein